MTNPVSRPKTSGGVPEVFLADKATRKPFSDLFGYRRRDSFEKKCIMNKDLVLREYLAIERKTFQRKDVADLHPHGVVFPGGRFDAWPFD